MRSRPFSRWFSFSKYSVVSSNTLNDAIETRLNFVTLWFIVVRKLFTIIVPLYLVPKSTNLTPKCRAVHYNESNSSSWIGNSPTRRTRTWTESAAKLKNIYNNNIKQSYLHVFHDLKKNPVSAHFARKKKPKFWSLAITMSRRIINTVGWHNNRR